MASDLASIAAPLAAGHPSTLAVIAIRLSPPARAGSRRQPASRRTGNTARRRLCIQPFEASVAPAIVTSFDTATGAPLPCIWRRTPSPREFRPTGDRLLKGQSGPWATRLPKTRGYAIAERYSRIRFSFRAPNPWNNFSCPMPVQHPVARQLQVLAGASSSPLSLRGANCRPRLSRPPAGAPVRPVAPSSIAKATFTALNWPVVDLVVVVAVTSMHSPLAGAQVLSQAADIPIVDIPVDPDAPTAKSVFVHHQLAANRCLVAVWQASRQSPRTHVRQWTSDPFSRRAVPAAGREAPADRASRRHRHAAGP